MKYYRLIYIIASAVAFILYTRGVLSGELTVIFINILLGLTILYSINHAVEKILYRIDASTIINCDDTKLTNLRKLYEERISSNK